MTGPTRALAGLLALAAQGAAAQQLDGCDLSFEEIETRVVPSLHGAWQVINGAGYLSGPGGTVPLPAAEGDRVTISYSEDAGLSARGPNWPEVDVFLTTETGLGEFGLPAPDAGTGDDRRVSRLDFDAFDHEVGCTTDLLPLVVMEGAAQFNGQNVHMEILVYFLHEDLLSGIALMNSGGNHMRRFITFLR